MNSFLKNIINHYVSKPKNIFILDGFGALISAVFLGIIFIKFQHFIGISSTSLYFLATVPIFIIFYDIYCFFKVSKSFATSLYYLAILNFSYSFLSLVFSFFHYKTITLFAVIYICFEISIICLLAFIELKTSTKLKAIYQ